MKAIIRKVGIKHITTTTGKKFDKIVIECDCIVDDKGTIKTYKSEMSPDYAKRYFGYCGLSSSQLPGKECEVTLRRRAFTSPDGKLGAVTEIKYLNMLDANGNPIIMRQETTSTEDIGF